MHTGSISNSIASTIIIIVVHVQGRTSTVLDESSSSLEQRSFGNPQSLFQYSPTIRSPRLLSLASRVVHNDRQAQTLEKWQEDDFQRRAGFDSICSWVLEFGDNSTEYETLSSKFCTKPAWPRNKNFK